MLPVLWAPTLPLLSPFTLTRVGSHQLRRVEGTQATRIADVEISGLKSFAGLAMNLPYRQTGLLSSCSFRFSWFLWS